MPAPRVVCTACAGKLRARDRFCPNCGQPVATAQTASTPAPQPPAPVESASLQVAGDSTSLTEQRRLVTVLFADLQGSTALGEGLDPEELREVLTDFFGAMSRQIRRYEGTLDKYVGDAIMAVFGVPVAHEDDAQRAVHAAIDMQRAVAGLNDGLHRRHGARLALRIGINTGEVVGGLLGGEAAQAYTIVGDTVNTAQRLEAAAEAGRIVIGALTASLVAPDFDLGGLEPLTLKGKAEPVPAWTVLGRRPRPVVHTGERSRPIVGREEALAQLRAAAKSHPESAAAVTIAGEPGVGKTRLLEAFLDDLPENVAVISARAVAYERHQPYALLVGLLRAAFRLRDGDSALEAIAAIEGWFGRANIPLDPATRALLLDILGFGASTLDPEARRRILVQIIRSMIQVRARQQLVVVVAEDMHWCDAASAGVMADLLPALRDSHCLLLATTRPEWSPTWEGVIVHLEPLPRSATDALLESVLEGPASEELAAVIMARAQGNPFFVQEIARSLLEGNRIGVRDGRWHATQGSRLDDLPATVQGLVSARIDRLGPDERGLLNVASVVGRTFSSGLVRKLVQQPVASVRSALATLETEGFIEPMGTSGEEAWSFQHALLQEVAYHRQLISQRARQHERVGDFLAVDSSGHLDEYIDVLAHHYSMSRNDGKARHHLLRAGLRAQRLYAIQEAAEYFRRALARSDADPRCAAAAHAGLGDIERLSGRLDAAIDEYTLAMTAARETPAEVGRLYRKIGSVQAVRAEREGATASFLTALEVLPADATVERAHILTEMGHLRLQQGDLDAALATLTQAVDTALSVGAEEVAAIAYRHIGTVHVMRGDLDSALVCYGRGIDFYTSLDDPVGQAHGLNNVGIIHRKRGAYAAAAEAHQQALDIRERVGDPMGVGLSKNNLAQIRRAQGDFATAEREYDAALSLFEAVGYTSGVAIARTGLGINAVEAGDAETGLRHLLTALDEWKALGNRAYLAEALRYVAQAKAHSDAAEALQWAELAVTEAAEIHSVEQEAIAYQVLGGIELELGRLESARKHLEASLAQLDSSSEIQERARTAALLAATRRALGEPHSDLVATAREIFTSLGAVADLRRLDAIVAGESNERDAR